SVNSGEPVIGATLFVEGTSIGVITNGEGFYALQLTPGTTYNISISCLGMEKEKYIVEVNNSGTLNIEMREQLIDIQEVVVRSGKHDNVRGMQMGFQKIDIKDIKSIPVVMGERDILKIAQMMPGVQSVGEGSSGFNVRGSTSDQNLFLLNDIPVLNTGHLFGFFSAFNPDMVSDFNLYKSNFPAEYGGRLASVFEVSTRKGNKKKFGARGAISPVTGSLLVETPLVKDKVSLIAGGRSTYSDWILSKLDNEQLNNSTASFYDLMSGVHIILDESSSLQLFGYYSSDKFTLSGTSSYKYENIGSSATYNRKLNEKWNIDISAVFSRYINWHSDNELPPQAFEHQFSVDQKELKTKVTGYKWLNHTTSFGGGVLHYRLNQGIYQPLGSESLISSTDFGKEQGMEFNIFASDEFAITDRLSIYAGLRLSLFKYLGPNDIYTYPESVPRETEFITDTTSYGSGETISNYGGPEYRLSFNYEISPDLSLKASYNRMRQYLFMLSNTIAMSPTDRWKLTDPYTRPPVSDQVSMGVYKNIPRKALETSAEIYYKKTHNQVEYKDGADLLRNPRFETSILQGEQNSWGAEFLVKRNAGRFTGWVSYAYSRALVSVNGRYDWDKINDGKTYPASYDKPHSVNFVGSYRFSRRISFASNLVYSTGRPITYPTGIFWIGGEQGIVYSNRNQYRIPDYFRVDVSLNFEGNLKREKLAHGSWMFAVYNVTGRKNAYSVYFKNEDGMIKGYKQSIYGVPIFTISYNFKLGNYAVE
ncbi:MAG: TonB-dependent receptor, partial [Bacteroidia bacterium]